jgi:hypothetical protein
LGTKIGKVATGERWIQEIKFDGYRVQQPDSCTAANIIAILSLQIALPRQDNGEFSEHPRLGRHVDYATVLLHDDVVRHRKTIPSPAGLVVKKGLNIFSSTPTGMPAPLSRMRISTVQTRLIQTLCVLRQAYPFQNLI